MPFPFIYVCDLLENANQLANRPLQLHAKEKVNDITLKWFTLHRHKLNEQSVDTQAVLAMLHPEKRADWDYGLDAERLEQLIARVLNLSRKLHDDLCLWREDQTSNDLGDCTEKVMEKMTVDRPLRAMVSKVMVEDIDQAMLGVAAHSPNSTAAVRNLCSKVKNHDSIELFRKFYCSLGGREAKWLTRLILKDYGRVKIPTYLDVSNQNAFLPRCVQMSAEVSFAKPLPVLREGTSLVYGFTPANVATQQLLSPALTAERRTHMSKGFAVSPPQDASMAATERLQKKYPASLSVATQLLTPTRFRGRRAASTAVRAPVYFTPAEIVTPPTTAAQPASSAPSSSPSGLVRLSRSREPLASLASNVVSSQSSCTKSQEPSSRPPFATALIPALETNILAASQPPMPAHIPQPPSQTTRASHSNSSTILTTAGSGSCVLTTSRCPLVNCIFLLAPCISDVPYIRETLLAWHGCRIISSVRAFADSSLPRHCPHTGKRYRKIALVDPNRTDQTVAFLKRIQGLNLQRAVRKGEQKVKEKQWVEVYDWKLLECVGKLDQGKDSGYNPWRRCWMGAV